MEDGGGEREKLTLVARKPCFGLPTACPKCLPVLIYLKLSKIPFSLEFNVNQPHSDQIPFVESGDYVAYNNEKGGVIEKLKEDGLADLDSLAIGIPEWVSVKAMVESWLSDAIMFELWLESDGMLAHKIYYSDLPWPIGKFLNYKQVRVVKQLLGISSENKERREEEIYSRSVRAYDALSSLLGEQSFFFENRPTSLDAAFLGHALFTLHALPETSVLRSKLLGHANLVNYAENLKMEYADENSPSNSSVSPTDPSSSASNRTLRTGAQNQRVNIGGRRRRKKRRAKYFLATQLVAVLIFLSILGGSNDDDVELADYE